MKGCVTLPVPVVQNLILTSVCSDNPDLQRRWRVRNPNPFPVNYTFEVYPNVQTGAGVAPPGDSFFFTNTIPGPNTTIIRWQDENGQTRQTVKASSGEQCPPPPHPPTRGVPFEKLA